MILKDDFCSKYIFLDNAATTLKPNQVAKAYYDNFYTKIDIEGHRERVASFLGTTKDKIKFTRGTTQSLNLIADYYKGKVKTISLPISSHHSNMIPWQRMGKLEYSDLSENGEVVSVNKTDLVTFEHVSNVLGTINDIFYLTKEAKKNNSIVVVDGAQAPSHLKVNVEEIGADFYLFSSHKMYGPTGLGILYDKNDIIEEDYNNTRAIASFSVALDYLDKNWHIVEKEKELTDYLIERLKSIGAQIYGSAKNRVGIVSFNINAHPHDVAGLLSSKDIAIRAGNHCAQPLMKYLDASSTCRASLGIYNDKKDIDALIEGLIFIKEMF